MTWYDSTADSALDGNRLYDAGGMFIHQNYAPSQPSGVLVPANITLQSANEIRGNVIDGVYNRSKPDSSGGGIQLGYGAVDRYCAGTHCVSAAAPPELGLGIIIAGNNISAADSQDPMDSNHWPTGAISLTRDWSTGPTDASGLVQWPLGDDTLIFHNTLQGISATAPGTLRPGEPRIGIGIDPVEHGKAYSQNAWRSTLYANHCAGVDNPVSDTGIGTVRYCPVGATDTCECRGQNAVNVSVAASASESGIEVGAPVTFTVTVTNDHELLAAHGVALIVEPPAGIRIAHLSLNSGTGFCDSSTNVCLLGPMSHGQSAAIRVAATALAAGMWDTTFSVTHREPDSAVVRSGATVSTLVSR
jgi:hypothetical protein